MKNRLTPAHRRMAAAAILAAGLVASASSGAMAATSSAAVVPSSNITVQVLAANGSGCPAGTAYVRPAADRTGFTVYYSAFDAAVGPGAEPTDIRANCQLSLLVTVPQGFTFAIARADYSGSLSLARGATALHRTNYYLQGSGDNNVVDHTFTGPVYGRWSATDTAAEPVYAPCGTQRILNVNTELRVSAGSSGPGSSSSITMRGSSGSVNSAFHFDWQQC